VELKNKNIYLIEGKHSKKSSLPSLEDIKDGLLKMILFTNLEDVKIDGKNYSPVAVLKLTIENHFRKSDLSDQQKRSLNYCGRKQWLIILRLFYPNNRI